MSAATATILLWICTEAGEGNIKMVDSALSTTPIIQARSLFETEALAFPPLPAAAAASLRAINERVFASRDLPAELYNLEIFSGEVLAGQRPADYSAFGIDGHGTNSWAVHYYNVEGPLALFVQLPWGGAYVDPDPAREVIRNAFGWAARIQDKAATLGKNGVIPPGWRLLVVASRFAQPGWIFVPPTVGDPEAMEWNRPPSLGSAVEGLLDDLAAGRTTIG